MTPPTVLTNICFTVPCTGERTSARNARSLPEAMVSATTASSALFWLSSRRDSVRRLIFRSSIRPVASRSADDARGMARRVASRSPLMLLASRRSRRSSTFETTPLDTRGPMIFNSSATSW